MIKARVPGFTLIEMIVAVVITGIVAAMVSYFIRIPILSYFDVAHRAEITDAADTAVRRISRDLRGALPNSIRQPESSCVEFLATKTGGRYRTDVPGTPLNFAGSASSFDYLGSLSSAPVANDLVVIYNLGITDPVNGTGADAYHLDNVATITSASAGSITFNSKTFPFRSPSNRFHILPKDGTDVYYVCTGVGLDADNDGTGTLYRYAIDGLVAHDLAACPAIPANTPVLARNVSSCNFAYASGVTERSGLVSIRLGITKSKETAAIHHEVHVNNAP